MYSGDEVPLADGVGVPLLKTPRGCPLEAGVCEKVLLEVGYCLIGLVAEDVDAISVPEVVVEEGFVVGLRRHGTTRLPMRPCQLRRSAVM